MLSSKGKRRGANIFLKKYAANKTLDTIVAQQQRNLDRYQVVSIVKKAAVEDDVFRQRLYDSISKLVPDHDQAIKIFESQLDDVTYASPDGYLIDSTGEQYLSYLKMGRYSVEEPEYSSGEEAEILITDAAKQGISIDLSDSRKKLRSSN